MEFSVNRLTKKFGDTCAVSDLSFSMVSGDIVGFVGPNGAGKTTTLRILSNLEEPTKGDIFIDNCSIFADPEIAKKNIGFVPDTLDVQANITIHEYLDFYARLYGFRHPMREQLIEEIEEFTNLTGIKEKFTTVLSKGMKQRVSIARALLNDPEIILMDEPAAGLDPRARIELRELLKILSKRNKMILISSHILTELSEICNKALIIEQGTLLKFGKINDIVMENNSLSVNKTIILTPKDNSENLCNMLVVIKGVTNVNIVGENVEFEFDGDDDDISKLIIKLLSEGIHLLEFKVKRQNLETVFMNLTKGNVQ